jgi:hypothetical protein
MVYPPSSRLHEAIHPGRRTPFNVLEDSFTVIQRDSTPEFRRRRQSVAAVAAVERRGPTVCHDSNETEGKGESIVKEKARVIAGFVDRLKRFGFPPRLYPSYEVLTFASVGLPPTEHISLSPSFSGHAEAQ